MQGATKSRYNGCGAMGNVCVLLQGKTQGKTLCIVVDESVQNMWSTNIHHVYSCVFNRRDPFYSKFYSE
jgi:hypothetical protein